MISARFNPTCWNGTFKGSIRKLPNLIVISAHTLRMMLAPLTFINEGFITKQCPSNVRSATKDMKRNENMLNIFYKVTTLFTNIMFEKYLFDHKVFSPFFLDDIERRKKLVFHLYWLFISRVCHFCSQKSTGYSFWDSRK